MVFGSGKEVENDVPMQLEAEFDLDQMDQRVQALFKLKNFDDKMDLRQEQRLAITKAIIKVTDPSGSSGVTENRLRRNSKFKDNAVVLFDNERCDLPSHHKHPLYVTVKVRDVELKRAIIDQGSPLNIISLSVLDAVDVYRDSVQRQLVRCQDLEVTVSTPLSSWAST